MWVSLSLFYVQIADVDGKGGNALAHKNQKHTTPTDYNDGDKTHIATYVFHYTGGAKAFSECMTRKTEMRTLRSNTFIRGWSHKSAFRFSFSRQFHGECCVFEELKWYTTNVIRSSLNVSSTNEIESSTNDIESSKQKSEYFNPINVTSHRFSLLFVHSSVLSREGFFFCIDTTCRNLFSLSLKAYEAKPDVKNFCK